MHRGHGEPPRSAGAFLLAEAGLLDGRRAVTHWASCKLLDQRYGNLTVRSDLDVGGGQRRH
jgi:transcriptional regulator GlxA family with amidase domain